MESKGMKYAAIKRRSETVSVCLSIKTNENRRQDSIVSPVTLSHLFLFSLVVSDFPFRFQST